MVSPSRKWWCVSMQLRGLKNCRKKLELVNHSSHLEKSPIGASVILTEATAHHLWKIQRINYFSSITVWPKYRKIWGWTFRAISKSRLRSLRRPRRRGQERRVLKRPWDSQDIKPTKQSIGTDIQMWSWLWMKESIPCRILLMRKRYLRFL